VANGVLTGEWRKCVRSENLTNKTNVFMQPRLFAIGNCDTRCLLSTVLQGKKSEE
jgi:hypothetical protein